MLELAIVPVLAAGLLQAPGAAQGLAIQHKAMKCIVAEKYPRLNACFVPSSQLARARVYFRVAEGPADWYYVVMKSDTPCFTGILPRPKRELIGRHVQYYLDASDRQFAESRTAETEALVVKSEADCEDRLLAAPWLDKATVTAFPRLPEGFIGAGLGTGAKAAIAGGVLVVGGGTAAILAGSGGSTPTTTTTTTTTTVTTTTNTTTLPPQVPFLPVFKVYRGGALQGDSITGPDPLPLLFDMCDSSGPFPLRFNVEVDGNQITGGCQSGLTFTTSGVALRASGVRGSASRTYSVVMWVRSVSPDNEPKEKRKLTVEVTSTSPSVGCSADTQGPSVSLTSPAAGSGYATPDGFPVPFRAAADDSGTGNNGIAFVEYKLDYLGPNALSLGRVTGGAPWPLDWSASAANAWMGAKCNLPVGVQAYAEDNCGNGTFSRPVTVNFSNPSNCFRGAERSAGTVSLVSELRVPGGSGQVVANEEATFPRAGLTPLAVRPVSGENRVEATLVEGSGPGTWLFDLRSVPGLRPESLRVIAGEVAQVGDGIVTFRLRGRTGERLVFSFRVEPDPGR